MDFAERRLGFRHRFRGRLERAEPGPLRAADHRAILARDAGERHRRHRLLFAPAGTGGSSSGLFFATDERLLLHFGAVDYRARVWVNGPRRRARGRLHAVLRRHHRLLAADPLQTVVVRADDDPHDLAKPRGKQDWQLRAALHLVPAHHRHLADGLAGAVPATYIGSDPLDPERRALGDRLRSVDPTGSRASDLRCDVKLCGPATILLADDIYTVVAGEVDRRIALSDPGIDDYRNELLWSPGAPTLIDARDPALEPSGGELIDDGAPATRRCGTIACRATASCSTAALTSCGMVLDQGYWPDTRLTAPDDDALRRDVELAKAMGFNGVRKHQKIEDPRYLYWADRLGLLVWEEMPSAYRFTRSVDRAADARVDRGDRARLQPSVHRRVGAVQRILGRARPARTSPAPAPLRAGALPPDQDARPDAAGDRQRRLGERRDRHHRHPRLRPLPERI